jgi:hypothetical protein
MASIGSLVRKGKAREEAREAIDTSCEEHSLLGAVDTLSSLEEGERRIFEIGKHIGTE